MNIELKQRLTSFLTALGVPTTAFCRAVGISTSALYKWRKGLLRLSDATLQRIDNNLSRYGF